MDSTFASEVSNGQRFEFGNNWALFLDTLTMERVVLARRSLEAMLGVHTLAGKTFLDVGSGSGLFSLAARQLGATVRSFDYDPSSVACTKELRERFFKDDPDWVVEEGSVLDQNYLAAIGQHDVVYSWGVLHHTGAMWEALANVVPLVRPGGQLFLAIYNDQGRKSGYWRSLKRTYNRLPTFLRGPYTVSVMGLFELKAFLRCALRMRPFDYVRTWTQYASVTGRGMSRWRDIVDWMGGYPFEVAKPEEIFRFYRDRGFQLSELATRGGSLGCNQFVFIRTAG